MEEKKGLFNTKTVIAIGCIVLATGLVWSVSSKKVYLHNAILASNSSLPSPSAEVLNLQDSFAAVAEHVKPAVVNISTLQIVEREFPSEFYFGDPFEDFFNDFFGAPYPQQRRQQYPNRQQQQRPSAKKYKRPSGTGSGVIIDKEGYILTNEHVVRDANEIKVTLAGDDSKSYTGKVVGKDARTDLAIIKITRPGGFPSVTLGDSDKVRVGDWAVAIGSPFGLEQTVTAGIISAVRQSLEIENKEYKDLFQTDAAINPGNSGGPLVNIRGDVIGINTAIYAPTGVFSGIGFAIPINRAKEVLDDLIHKGKVVRGYMGIGIQEVSPAIRKQFGIPADAGVLINNVMPNTPAEKAGIQRGDVILKYNGKTVKTARELQQEVATTNPKQKVPVELLRDGKKVNTTIELMEMPSEEELAGQQSDENTGDTGKITGEKFVWKGLTVINTSKKIAEQYGLPADMPGVIVIDVEQGSAVDDVGLDEGDLILSVNRMKARNINEFESAVKKVNLTDGVVFDINRQGQLLYISYSGE
ncbi:MAG: Do family serine endopeptidase [Elusimicrobiota bacterium]